ncbi:RelA/SpoT domain-containing protein [Actinoplanes sp. LDG1-06]|uniref:RelA/SpoT domain-containing protein n=1 Tax=Paractinoplanes ovalisporus TaxID=2810368 RepID=A0ABS2ATN0_9ACTN|nr:RelA/SpoT domain-containing protein [Actinoplanes ovalisporus]MBM2623227.1 RelA/SpoT domain-containing protein [Actinoplanes ovalisporus]
METHATSEIVGRFVQIRPLFADFAARLERLLKDLLAQNHIDIIQIESRAKDVSSFERKLELKANKYADPLKEMTDLTGVRIITYYLEDGDEVEALIRREFEVDEENSVDKSALLDPDRFGYLSRHFIVSIASPRADLPEWARYADFKAEIQVRTALQHAWAAVNHKLEYKSQEDVPRELKRGLGRLSALFEIADSQFSQFRSDRDRVSQAYGSALDSGDYSIELDLASLDEYLERSPSTARLRRAIDAVGQTLRSEGTKDDFDKSNILAMLRILGMTTVADLDTLIKKYANDRILLEVVRDLGTPRTPVSLETFLVNMMHLENPAVDGEVALGYMIDFDMSPDRALLAARRAGEHP